MASTLTYSLRLALVATLLHAVSVHALEPDLGAPLVSRNLDPVIGNLGVPTLGRATDLTAGEWRGTWGLHWASHSHRETAGEALREYDGETLRQDVYLAVGLGRGVTASVNIPWVRHTGGTLDPLIEGWHSFWGMPNGSRDDQPDDRLLFSLDGDGGFLLDSDVSGLGDIELAVSVDLLSLTDDASLAGFVQYKVATGDEDDFTGTGDDAIALGVRYSNSACLWEALSCHGQFGIVDVGDLQQGPAPSSTVLFGGVSLAWIPHPRVALIAQLEVQEQPYGAGPLEDVGTPVLGTLGMRWRPINGWDLEMQFSEDLNVGSAPDVTFRFAVSRRW